VSLLVARSSAATSDVRTEDHHLRRAESVMPVSYQDLLVNTVNSFINNLVIGAQPPKDPGMTAWAWFRAAGGAQPAQANDYVQPLLVINMKTIADPWYAPVNDPVTNWVTWSSALNTNLSAAPIGGTVRKWLDTMYIATREDPPTVPEDVINWTKEHLPGTPAVVIRKSQGVKS
jgi:hypothetical protein